MDHLGRDADLVDVVMLCAALRGERQHCDARVHAAKRLCARRGRDRDLGKLFGRRVDVDRAVRKDHQTVVAVLLVRDLHDEEARNRVDAGLHLDDLQPRTERIAGGVDRAGNEAVALAVLNHHRGEEQRILDHIGCLFGCDALCLAHLIEAVDVKLIIRMRFGIDRVDAFERYVELLRNRFDLFALAEQRDLCNTFCRDAGCRLHGAFFGSFWQQDVFLVCLCFCLDRIHQ